ncbi:MAG: hypothetical protein L3J32_02775 [Rhizobiaceae bacterium]|nr:hypothetical protein [Rhizobiaceae bacterium]
MQFKFNNLATAGALSIAVFVGTLGFTTPANATHEIGHAIVGGIIGGIIGGAIARNNRRQPVYQQPVYQQPVYQRPIYQPPVYQPQVRSCYWKQIVEYDRWGGQTVSNVRVCR